LNPHYPSLLSRLKSENQAFLDLGCCFGQDLRALAAAGAPLQNLYATDLRRDFWELGYELFKDKETLKSRFIEGDVMADESTTEGGLKELDGKINIVYAGSFLHLFDYAGQFKVCERIVRLLKPVKGSVVLGRQSGHVVAGERAHRTNYREKVFRHNEESFKKMWEEVGEKTGTRWKVEVELQEVQDRGPNVHWDPDTRRLKFTVFRE
jgi:SAM-dependent methyltransferase